MAAIRPILPAESIGGWGTDFMWTYPEGTSQTFVGGAPLKFSSGTAVIISSVTAPTIIGIAMGPAHNTTAETYANQSCKVVVPFKNVVFEVSVDTTTTSGTAALKTGYPSQFTIGTNYQLLLDSTTGYYYMGTGTSNAVFHLLGYDPSQASVVNGRVYATILTSQTVYS